MGEVWRAIDTTNGRQVAIKVLPDAFATEARRVSYSASEMPFSSGTRFGAYELRSVVGKGGMGDVYRARDTRLERDVAIKVLPDHFATDHVRRQRFNLEARAIASLSHPHICSLYDIGSEGGTDYLVMELIEGESLADRLLSGPLSCREALDRATDIADALSAAHRIGLVHRDLKPANVMLTRTGAKLLDFGVAAIRRADEPTNGPTLTAPLTEEGTIVGTLSYMAPEQIERRTVDSRADIFAFGAVLHEMLTGRRAFGGDSRASVIAAILKEDPQPIQSVVVAVPFGLDRVVRKCLAKNPDERWQTASDLRDELIWIAEGQSSHGSGHSSTEPDAHSLATRRERLAWAVAAIATAGLVAALGWPLIAPSATNSAAEVRLDVTTPQVTNPMSAFSFALSPDGQKLAFVAPSEGVDRIWVRSLDSSAATALKGTEGASHPFWKPDGQSIGFFAKGMLSRIDLSGGLVQRLAPANSGRGGTWNRLGTIVFVPGNIDPMYQVADTGGTPRLLFGSTAATHRFPQFLSDDEHVVFFTAGGVHVVAISGGAATLLAPSDTSAAVTRGNLFFMRGGTLYALRFDEQRRTSDGEPFPIADSVMHFPTKGAFTASSTGTLAYRTGGRLNDQLLWLDRTGTTTRFMLAPDEGGYFNPVVSGDGRVLFQRRLDRNWDIWLGDGGRRGVTRTTLDTPDEICPVWSPDGQRFVFSSNRSGLNDLYQRALGGGDELLLKSPSLKIATDWSRDGRYLLYRVHNETRSDLWVLPLVGGTAPYPLTETRFDEREGQFSPDGKWVAYQSDESGRYEIYLQPFTGSGERIPVSVDGGTQPRWGRDGRELYFVSLDEKLVAVPIRLNDDSPPQLSTPVALFQTLISGGAVPGANRQQYDVSADGQQFLMSVSAVDGDIGPISMVLNWNPANRVAHFGPGSPR